MTIKPFHLRLAALGIVVNCWTLVACGEQSGHNSDITVPDATGDLAADIPVSSDSQAGDETGRVDFGMDFAGFDGDDSPMDVEAGGDSVEGLLGDYPVIVVGAGTGGTMAAIQAARLGVPVALLEETDWVGGQMAAAAVSTMDEGNCNPDSGLYKEFWTRADDYYRQRGRTMAVCYFGNGLRCLEASVARSILLQMIADEPLIDLFLRTRVTRVDVRQGLLHPVVAGLGAVQNKDGVPVSLSLSSRVVIDATEHGDVIPLASVPYRLANETNEGLSPDRCVQDITYTAVIRRYPNGVPDSLRMASPPPGYTPQVESAFAAVVSQDGHDWRTELGQYPVNLATHSSYRAVPDSASATPYGPLAWESITRTGVNWANDFPYDVQSINDPASRRLAQCAAKLRTLQFLYYMQTVLGASDWAVADDEGFDTPFNVEENSCPEISDEFKSIERHLPVMPYVRESRRIIGLDTLTARDIKRIGLPAVARRTYRSALAVGDYAVDLHNCNQEADLEAGLETVDDVPAGFVHGPFQIPFEVFVPTGMDGFLAAEKNLSLSRLASGACRLQPITMLTGQASGAIAALSVRQDVQPRDLEPVVVQKVLVEAGSRLTLSEFLDVPRGSSAWQDVQLTAVQGVMTGDADGRFWPEREATRAEVVAVVARLFSVDLEPVPATSTFADVATSDWFFPYIEALHRKGWILGCSTDPTRFCPSELQDRRGFAVMLARGLDLELIEPQEPFWLDVAPRDLGFLEIEALTRVGILEACALSAKHFCPAEPIVRAHVSGLAARCMLRNWSWH